ncbi:hypothetical protein NHX12_007993 [Muraenolepis orangiensis]|uniref:SH3 domain-containing protein n=1 Tax=Muraenolepis orangiensis TaxID=630683 RepID=A0A9Q0IAV4_9TELE|nr:hypothetical protein NHX12_007993 [Muraenolepis orangiensis]
MEVFDDSSSSPSGTLRNYPLTCKVLYSYKASQPDELTIDEQEMLEVIEDGDMEDWVKARNKTGQVGYVPEKYLQFPTSNSLLSMLQSLSALDARSHTSSNSTEPELHTGCLNGENHSVYVRALYDYEGQAEEELSFVEGAVIRLLSRDTQTDDGFWEGELNGRVGVFPSVLVEDLAENGEAPDKVSLSQKMMSSLPPLPLYDQPPISPFTSPESTSTTPPPLPRSPSITTLAGVQCLRASLSPSASHLTEARANYDPCMYSPPPLGVSRRSRHREHMSFLSDSGTPAMREQRGKQLFSSLDVFNSF